MFVVQRHSNFFIYSQLSSDETFDSCKLRANSSNDLTFASDIGTVKSRARRQIDIYINWSPKRSPSTVTWKYWRDRKKTTVMDTASSWQTKMAAVQDGVQMSEQYSMSVLIQRSVNSPAIWLHQSYVHTLILFYYIAVPDLIRMKQTLFYCYICQILNKKC